MTKINLDLQGWFHPDEGKWYEERAKELSNGWIVEIGCWKGLSTSYLAPVLVGKPQRLWCIDNWEGSKDQYAEFYKELLVKSEKEGIPVPEQFQENLKTLEIPYKLLQMPSMEAVKQFKNNSCSLVFIDASHDYSSVKDDLNAWWLRVSIGGILAGHNYSKDFPELIRAIKEFSEQKSVTLRRGPKTIYYFNK